MAVLSTVVGIAVAPFTGEVPCGFMRRIKHRCSDSTCPLNSCYVMAFDYDIKRAILSCRRLWDIGDDVPLIYRRVRVMGDTLRIASADFEEGLASGDPAEWAILRSQAAEHDRPAMQLTSVSALLSFRGSPGGMWALEGDLMYLPAGIAPERSGREHQSWWDAGLPDLDDLIE